MTSIVDDVLKRGETAIKELVGRSENLNLEFKTKEHPESFTLSKFDKRNIGAALSAFSNADGGVLIYGVKTRRQDQIDVASELCPIAEIARFKSEVHGRLDELIRPANPDVSTHIIQCSEDPDRGYLLVVIGKSDNRPHMSMAPDHAKYFRRSFDRSLVMDHGLIRDLIMAPKEAILTPAFRLDSQSSTGHLGKRWIQAHLEVYLHNSGRSMASMPYVRIYTNPRLQHLNVHRLAPSYLRPDGSVAYYGSRDAVIHPSDGMLFGAFSIKFATNQDEFIRAVLEENWKDAESPNIWEFGKGSDHRGPAPSIVFDELEMRLSLGAENATIKEERKFFTKANLIALALPAVLQSVRDIELKETALARALAQIEDTFGVGSVQKLGEVVQKG